MGGGNTMSIELTNEEKVSLVNQHIKSLVYSEYNVNLSLLEVQAMAIPNQENLDSITLQLNDIASKKQALEQELASLT